MATLSLSLTLLCVMVSAVFSAPTIDAPWARIAGLDFPIEEGPAFVYGYLGVPFALPPVGERRFKKPEPHPGPGAGRVFNASTPGLSCPQPDEDAEDMSEDCLTLNIFTPTTPSQSGGPYSVMIWIHGGGYTVGSAHLYRPGRMVSEGDVIVVVIQYRLGVLGFLNTGDKVSPGNYGLWDQHLAIKWVKDNIRAFGGNPDSITIFGESAGAGSVGFQHLSPYSKGLFSRAILQSGSPLAQWSLNKKPTDAAKMLADATGCVTPSEAQPPMWVQWYARYVDPLYLQYWMQQLNERAVECLRKVSVDKLLPLTNVNDDYRAVTNPVESSPWVPSVDGDFVPRDPGMLMEDPEYLLQNGVLARDVMHGVNNNEGVMIVKLLRLVAEGKPNFGLPEEALLDQYATELRYRLGDAVSDEQVPTALAEIIRFFYFEPRVNGQIDAQNLADTFSDQFFIAPLVAFLRGYSRSAAAIRERSPGTPIGRQYVYLFDHYPAFKQGEELQGMDHGEDILYQFDASFLLPRPEVITAEDVAVAQTFVALQTDFAKTGNPNSALGAQLNGAIWPMFSATDESYLALAPQPRIERNMYPKRVGLWLELIPTLLSYTQTSEPSGMAMMMNWQSTMMNNRMTWQYSNQHMRPYGYMNGRMQFCF